MTWRAVGPACMLLLALQSGTASGREALGYADLSAGGIPVPVDLEAFAPDGSSQPPSNTFEGRLRLSGIVHSRVVHQDPGFVSDADVAAARTLPQDFDFAFIQEGDALIPVRRGAIPGAHRYWEWILEPGRVWDEPGDRGLTRAAIPFSLEEKNANCTHHGVITFLFRNDGTTSRAVLQVSGETCFYLQVDLWGSLRAQYLPGAIADRGEIAAAYRAEVAARLPVIPIGQLPVDHPGIDPTRLALGAAQARTGFGLLANGRHYVSGCATRAGEYPYCDVLDLPSYSTAKSAFAAIALMRLQALTGQAAGERIGHWIRGGACADATWQAVSFADALNMATAHYDSAGFESDEDSPKSRGLFLPLRAAEKLRFACGAYPARGAPGSLWVYRTSDTYVLGTALNAYFRSLPGREHQDIYTDLVWGQIFSPLKLSPVMRDTRRTYDTVRQPFTGWGLLYHRDDIARLASFLLNDAGRIAGKSLLDEHLLAAALQRDPNDRGLPTADLKGFRYKNGFWARNVQPLLACQHEVWVPFMSGFGGISVVLFPNGVVYYNFADDGKLSSFDWGPVVSEVNKLGLLCTGQP